MANEKGNHLLEKSILPVGSNGKTMGMIGYFMLWVGMVVMIVAYQFGGDAVSSYPLLTSIIVIFAAYLAIGFIMLLSADIGTEHGLSFAVFLRAPFGIIGTHFPVVSRGVVAACWFGIQTYLGALALNGIFQYLVGYDNWILWYTLFAIVQLVNTALGIKAVETFANLAAPILIAISVWMYYHLDGMVVEQGENIWTFVGGQDASLLAIFMANLTLWAALAIDIPNISRYLKVKTGTKSFGSRNRNIFLAQLVALPVVSTLMAFIGAIAYIATGDWNPITIIQNNETGFSLIVLLALVTIAQWSTNNAANLIPAALAFVNAAAPHLSYKMGVVLAGIIGSLSMPWFILDNLYVFLGYFGATLSAIAGIMFCDYYLIRKRRLNVPDLYKVNGQFRYAKGFNPAGFIAWVVSGALAILFMEYSYIIGIASGAILYYALMTGWILKKYPQQEIESNFDDNYLAASVNIDWTYSGKKDGFVRTPVKTIYKEEQVFDGVQVNTE
jgi:nucleobase:cation symporter-1, NCS1 family